MTLLAATAPPIALEAAWDRLALELQSPVAATPAWCRAWWRHYGAGREAHALMVETNGALAGIVPLCVGDLRLGPLRLRLARLAGSDSTQVVCDPPLPRDSAENAIEPMLEHLFGDLRCDLAVFGPLPEESATLAALRAAARRRPDLACILHDRPAGCRTVIDLPESFEAYLCTLSANQRAGVRKEMRRLEARGATTEILRDPDDALAAIEELIALHGAQWRSTGRLGHFGDWPGAAEFHRSLVGSLAAAGRVRMLRLALPHGEAHGASAIQYAQVLGDRAHCVLSARDTGSGTEGLGLGRVSLARMIEALIAEGVRSADVGVGHYDYKQRLGGRERPLRTLAIAAARPSSRTRARAAAAAASLLDRVYYRAWYCRLRPRTPVPHRPLRKSWIRSRL